jgi:hypothetical protein
VLYSSNPYVTNNSLKSTRGVILAIQICQREAISALHEKIKVMDVTRKTITYCAKDAMI